MALARAITPQQPDADPVRAPPVQLLVYHRVATFPCHRAERSGAKLEGLAPGSDEGGEGSRGSGRVGYGDLQAGDAGRAVRVLGRRAGRDAQGAGGEVL